jgi:hypothetical protein
MSLPASVVAFGLFLAEIRPRTAPGLPRTDSNRGICFSRKIRKRLLHLSSTTFRQDDQGVSATGRENMEYLAVCYAMFQTRSVYRVLISELWRSRLLPGSPCQRPFAPEDRFGFHTQGFGHHSGGSTMIAGGSASFRC